MKILSLNFKSLLEKSGRILFGVLCITLFCLCIKDFTSDKSDVALVNINAIVNRYIHSMAKSKLDDKTLQEYTSKFMRKLEQELNLLAQEKKIGLLVSEAIIAGGVDYTAEIEQRVYREYEKEVKPE